MAEVTSESLVMAQQVSSLSSSLRLRLRWRDSACQGVDSHPRAQRGAAACWGLWGPSPHITVLMCTFC